jgi:hypothetical protein
LALEIALSMGAEAILFVLGWAIYKHRNKKPIQQAEEAINNKPTQQAEEAEIVIEYQSIQEAAEDIMAIVENTTTQ